jgi:ABC-2 type transport system permease protein
MTALVVEAGKLGAFVRRDVLVALSYRAAFAGDALSIGMQLLMFALVAQVVDEGTLPEYGGVRADYLEFVVVGLTLTLITGTMLIRVSTAIRQEQLIGTFEALLTTPTRMATLQAGAVALDALLIPVRTAVYVLVAALIFDLQLESSGLLPATVVLLAFTPFVWGIGLISAGAMVTFRRGGTVLGAFVTGMGIASGVYFPLSVLPGAIQDLAASNPFAIAIEALRETLIGGGGWSAIGSDVLLLLPLAGATMLLGMVAFAAAVHREYRNGTLGLY